MMRAFQYVVARANHLFDSVCVVCGLLVTFAWLDLGRLPGSLDGLLDVRLTVRNVVLGLVLIAIWHMCFAVFGLYRPGSKQTGAKRAREVALATALGTLCVSLVLALVDSDRRFGPQVIASFWIAATVVELTGRGLLASMARYLEQRGRETKHVVIVGSGPCALRLYDSIRARPANCEFVGFVDTVEKGRVVPPEIQARLIASIEGLEDLLSARAIDEALMALPVKSCYATTQRAIGICEEAGVEVKYFPDMFTVSLAKRAIDDEDEMLAVRLQLVADDYRLFVKRIIDFAGAAFGLMLLSPLFALCAVAVKRSGSGPVFFSQVRYGYRRRLFRMYKFRTMVQDAEALQGSMESLNEARGPIFKIRNDPRITRVGGIMRKLSLDELPQLFNVLMGDMSLVGPRPMSVRDVSRFSESCLMRRFSVKPGLTCLWQVNGRSNTDFKRWVELDLAYIDNWSLGLDMRILLKTFPAVISGTGAM